MGEAVAICPLNGGVGLVGEAACEGGVGRVFGEATDGCTLAWPDTEVTPGSSFGAMLDADLREL